MVETWKNLDFLSPHVNQCTRLFGHYGISSYFNVSFNSDLSSLSNFKNTTEVRSAKTLYTPSSLIRILFFPCKIFSSTSLFHDVICCVNSSNVSSKFSPFFLLFLDEMKEFLVLKPNFLKMERFYPTVSYSIFIRP